MSTLSETRNRVATTFRNLKETVGYVPPAEAASALAPEELRPVIEKVIFQHPTEKFLFQGVGKVISQLADEGDTVFIWSDEYLTRIASSKLEERHRLALAIGVNKHDVLVDLFAQGHFEHIQNIGIVDNRLENLAKAKEIVDAQNLDLTVSYFWISEDFPVTELPNYRQGPTLWLIDFNHTLLDTNSYEESVVDSISSILTLAA